VDKKNGKKFNFRSFWDKCDIEERKKIIDSMIDKINITGDKWEIHWKSGNSWSINKEPDVPLPIKEIVNDLASACGFSLIPLVKLIYIFFCLFPCLKFSFSTGKHLYTFLSL